jgi:hypothetical protein
MAMDAEESYLIPTGQGTFNIPKTSINVILDVTRAHKAA